MMALAAIFDYLTHFFAYLLVAKYVFFEKGLKDKAKVAFYVIISLGIIITPFLEHLEGGGIAPFALLAWLIMQRKQKKYWAALLMIPIVGIVDGLLVPIVYMPPMLFSNLSAISDLYILVMDAVLTLVLVSFTIWLEKRDSENIAVMDNKLGAMMDFDSHDRKLSKTEKGLLYFVGIFEMFFSLTIYIPFDKVAESVSQVESIDDLMITAIENEDSALLIRAFLSDGEILAGAIKGLVLLLGIATFFMTVIVIIVVLVGNKRSYYLNKVTDIQYNIIVTMADIVENRDQDTGDHIQRTARYVDIIAKQMKLSGPYQEYMTDQFLNDIRVAAPLHDVGKIHVSDTVLNFPGRLSDEQFAIMKTHAAEGKLLLTHAKQRLGDFSYLDVAIDMAGYHHEWWDGSKKGYPEQLKGEEIPLCARIMAVADVFDALTARRVYKEPMPVQKAIDIILSERGTHFDPVVVDAFMDAIVKIKIALKEFENGV